MTSEKIIASLLLLSCCGPLLTQSTLTVVPINNAVFVGSTVQLHCAAAKAPPFSRVRWTEFASNSRGLMVSDGKTISASHPSSDRYDIVGGELDYILQITNVTLSDGGMYLCQDVRSGPFKKYRGYAELVVLESDPQCQDFETDHKTGVVIEGTSYSSECKIGYRGNLAPVMEWKGPGDFITNGSSTDKSVWSSNTFTADRKIDGEVFTCHTNFGPVVAEPDHASNTPPYEHTYRSSTIYVYWGPKNLYIVPIKAEYVENETLTCFADANPPPFFLWQNMRNLEWYPDQEFRVTPDMVGYNQTMRCQAQNLITGFLYTEDILEPVFVPASTTPSPSTTTLSPSSTLTVVPINTAVFVGSTVQLHCAAADTVSRVIWTEFASNPGGLKLSDGKTILASHPSSGRYDIVGGELDYILQITNVTLSDAGTYLCQDAHASPPNTFRGYAELVVLESDPQCQDFVTLQGDFLEGTSYSSECKIGYRGNLAPVMEWNGPGDFITNGSSTDESVWSSNTFTADREIDGEVFTCHTNFGPVVAKPDHASNTPPYEHTYRSSTILVKWGPKNMYICPTKAEYVENETLTCFADANPPCFFKWQNTKTLEFYYGQEFRVTADMVGHNQTMMCQTDSLIEGVVYTQKLYLPVYVPGKRLKKGRHT